jgi:CPA2 family monovalent cation:H+ antiporter-2
VRREKARGEPIFFGDASQEAILAHARVDKAKVVAVAISDPMAVAGIVQVVRFLNRTAHIIVRTRFAKDRAELLRLGATEVVTEEFESSMEIFSRVLATYLIPRGEIDRFLEEVRADGYAMSRPPAPEGVGLCEFLLLNFEFKRVRVEEGSQAAGKSIGEIGLRRRFKVTLLAMRRGTQVISDPGADTVLESDDLLLLVGRSERFPEAETLFQRSTQGGIQ